MRLSVCIPTYNFGAFIGETLESILTQVQEGVEVVVLDGGSTDETSAVVEGLQQRHASLRYERRGERGGIDRDMARTVELARGEYCWLFCADDVMKPGAIRRMLKNLDSNCDVYVCGMTLCSFDMRPLADHRVSKIEREEQFQLADARERESYFEQALTTTAFFSFAGSLIFKKSRWDDVPLDQDFVGSLWAHVARLFQLIPGGLRLHYLPESYLLKRTENDSFMDNGLVARYAIAIDGYQRLADACFAPGSREAFYVRRALANEFPPWLMLRLKFGSDSEAAEVDRLAAKVYRDRTLRNLIWRLVYEYTPRMAFRAVQRGYRAGRPVILSIRTRRRREPRAAAL